MTSRTPSARSSRHSLLCSSCSGSAKDGERRRGWLTVPSLRPLTMAATGLLPVLIDVRIGSIDLVPDPLD